MEEFNKKIRRKLANAPEHQVDEEVWKLVEARISPWHLTFQKNWGKMVLVAMLLTIVGLTSFWLGTRNRTKQSAIKVSDRNQQEVSTASVVPDTVFIKDTVYRFITITKAASSVSDGIANYFPAGPSRSLFDFQRQMRSDPSYDRPIGRNDVFQSSLVSGHQSITGVAPSDQVPKSVFTGPLAFGLYDKGVDNLRQERVKSVDPISTIDLIVKSNQSKKLVFVSNEQFRSEEIIRAGRRWRWIKALIPRGHRLGVLAGGINPLGPDLEERQEWIFGLRYELRFSPRLSILSGIRYRSYRGKNEHNLDEVRYPLPLGLRPGDRLDEVYINKSYVSIPAVLKYSFFHEKNYRPYLKGGLLFSSNRSQDFIYEIKRIGDDEIKLRSTVDANGWLRSALIFGTGLEFDLTARLVSNFEIEGRFHDNVDPKEYDANHGLGVRFGLSYGF